MHVVMFTDQHPASMGGAQVSLRLPRHHLEALGHTVTMVCARRLRAGGAEAGVAPAGGDAGVIEVPSVPLTWDREYSLAWPSRRHQRLVDVALGRRPPADLVHVQGDFWGAIMGHRYAREHALPVVHTMHNRLDEGLRAVSPVLAAPVLRALNAWQRAALPGSAPVGREGWSYLGAART